MNLPTEMTCSKGYRWIVRECGEEDECVVIEKHYPKTAPEDCDEFHVPGDVVDWLAQHFNRGLQ